MPATVRPILILGPTAGGKSELAVRLAEHLCETIGKAGQIIGADSMQIYRHMDAGTAKPSPQQLQRATHHMIDIVEPTERFTVAHWIEQTDTLIQLLCKQGVTPIIVGGTNLYIKALLEGLFDGPAQNAALREQLSKQDNATLHARLRTIDPAAGERIHPNDRKRMVRAIEVFEQTGQPISELQTQWDGEGGRYGGTEGRRGEGAKGTSEDTEPSELHRADTGDLPISNATPYRHNPILIGLQWSAEAINPRINLRVRAMFFPDKVDKTLAMDVTPRGESLPDEIQRLEAAGILGEQAREALGYKQVLMAMRGEMSMDDAYERTKILTRRFAKQQRTWLKRFRDVHWITCPTEDIDTQAFSAIESIE